MLKDDVWEKINPEKNGWVCVGCMEEKLGRVITTKDLDLVRYPEWEKENQDKKRRRKIDYEVAEYMKKHFRGIYDAIKRMI
jgi:hypothetical protein